MMRNNFITEANTLNKVNVLKFNFDTIKISYFIVLTICAVFQWGIFFDIKNAFCTLLIIVSSAVTIIFLFSDYGFLCAPIPALMIFLFNVTSLSGPLILKSLEGGAVIENLFLPEKTFSVLALSQISLLAALYYYNNNNTFQRVRGFLSVKIIEKFDLFYWPENSILWVMGFIGLIGTFLIGGGSDPSDSNILGKFLGGLQVFRYAPFLIVFKKYFDTHNKVSGNVIYVGMFFLLLMFAGLVQNSRGIFIDAIMMCVCMIILCVVNGSISLINIRLIHVFVFAFLVGFIYIFMTKLALAMVAIRSYRGVLGYMELASLSIEAFFDSRLTSDYQASEELTVFVGDYGENYISSRLLSRLIMIKFHDNMFYYLSLMPDSSLNELYSYAIDKIIGILPQPILDFLKINIIKENSRESFGDYVIYLVDGWGLGGYKTGSMIADLYAMSGVFFPLFLFFGGLILFVVYDSFRDKYMNISPVLGLMIWNVVGTLGSVGLNAESVVNVISGTIRTLPQNLLLYLGIVYLLNFVGFKKVRV